MIFFDVTITSYIFYKIWIFFFQYEDLYNIPQAAFDRALEEEDVESESEAESEAEEEKEMEVEREGNLPEYIMADSDMEDDDDDDDVMSEVKYYNLKYIH